MRKKRARITREDADDMYGDVIDRVTGAAEEAAPTRRRAAEGESDKPPLVRATVYLTPDDVLAIDRIHGFIRIANPEEDDILPGDCEPPPGRLDEMDAACALQISVRLRPVLQWMDIDGSGDVTSRDATIILQQANVSWRSQYNQSDVHS